MAKVLTDPAFYTAIADAIRSKLGGSTTYKPSEMAAAIASIPSGGDALAISVQPYSLTVPVSETATFAVAAVGTGLTFQWQWKTSTGTTWSNSSSSTTGYNKAVLRPVGTTGRNGYMYRCVVKDSSGKSVTSSAATLTVKS